MIEDLSVEDLPDEGIRKSTALGNRVEALPDLGDVAALDQCSILELVSHDDGRYQSQAVAVSREEAKHGHVVDLGKNHRANPGELHQPVERDANVAVQAWNQDRRRLQVFRKP